MRALPATLLALTAVAGLSAASPAPAPQPLKPVVPDRLFTGRWYEIGRRPMALTDGCVAGATDYRQTPKGTVAVEDSCRKGTPGGKYKSIKGEGRFTDVGTHAKLRMRYNFLITWDYWILDHDEAYSWFIESDPRFKNLWIYTRDPNPSEATIADLTRRAAALGYDVTRLEFPARASS